MTQNVYNVEGRGPALFLVPGLDGTALLFYRQIPRLAPRFRVVSFPLPDDALCTMGSLVSDLERIIDAVSPGDRVLLFGESFGGALSLSFALAHPERLRGLVILNSFPRVRRRFAIRVGPALLGLIPWGAMPLARRFTEAKLHTAHTLPDDLREFRQRSRAIGKHGYVRRLEILQSYDIREPLRTISTPTLFLAADQDQLLDSVQEARFMMERMPNAQMKVLRGFGHICLINHDFDLMESIAPWLSELA